MDTRINEITIRYRPKLKAEHWPKISSSSLAAQVVFENWDHNTIAVYESFKILLLNNSNKVKGIYQISDRKSVV